MRNKLSFRIAVSTFVCCLLTACAPRSDNLSDIHLPAIESDNMMLQAGSKARFFGSAAPGEKLTINYGHRTTSTKANANGQWQVFLTELKPGETFDIVIKGANNVTVKNVLVGQVWLCSGQSNMESPLVQAIDGAKEVAAAGHDQIRLFNVGHHLSTRPLTELDGSWKVCDPAAAAPFSAVAYFFGRALSEDLKTPVGLIESSWGGTPAQAWTSLEGLEADPVTRSRYAAIANTQMTQLVQALKGYEKALADWRARDMRGSHAKDPQPVLPFGLQYPYAPTMLFNGMISPLIPYSIGGVIWYQGESNARQEDETMAYRRLFPALIKDWRKQFDLPNLPFLYVQLANYGKKEGPNERSPWAELREAQLLTLSLPHTGMVVAIDIGDEKEIHLKNKQDVGKRLERIAMARVYGKQGVFSGPIFKHLEIKGDKAICLFDYCDQGLKTKDGSSVVGFVIRGADKKFVPADAVISGNTVVVSSPSVSQPVAVRYAWQGCPPNNLYNGAGLPASPFRSDVTSEPGASAPGK